MQRKQIIIGVLVVILFGAGGIIGYYAYQGQHFVSTDDARIAADVVAVSPEIAGKVLEWRVKEGDMVQKDDVLGQQDLGAELTSGAMGLVPAVLLIWPALLAGFGNFAHHRREAREERSQRHV